MRLSIYLTTAALTLALAASAASADWKIGDDYKMHFPQLPDADGWDVAFAWMDPGIPGVQPPMRMSNGLADDWRCSQTGAVSDVHFWLSMKGDTTAGNPLPFQINSISLTFWNDLPVGPNRTFSMPDRSQAIRTYTLQPSQFTLLHWGQGPQGWYNPGTGLYLPNDPPDHLNTYEVNIPFLDNAFIQQQGTVYWLELDVLATLPSGEMANLGWKTADLATYPAPYTGSHYQDDAVYATWEQISLVATNGYFFEYDGYNPLELPPEGIPASQDLAFVITPEPTSLAFLALGGVALLGRRRRDGGRKDAE
jgi:hypothetical protein